jgi:hypothetical protein
LLAAFCVTPGRLDVAVSEGAYPHICPRGRDRERLDPPQDILLSQLRAVRAPIAEARSGLLSAYARPGIGDISQGGSLSSASRIDNCRCAIRRTIEHQDLPSPKKLPQMELVPVVWCWKRNGGASGLDELLKTVQDFFRGTFLPFFRALDSPMAIACLRLFTLPALPPLPLFAVPRL